MTDTHSANTRRIAKNTAYLYGRTLVMMLISLYTSRVVLESLGIDDFGINNVVGGVVGMFSIISGSLSGSISRFLTFALGEGDTEKLRKVFSISVSIQILIGIVILLAGEAIGVWFINCKLNIPPDRLMAAHWVFQCGLISFFVGLISVPYNACLIAHEHMNVFAYMTILDAAIKLLLAYTIFIIPFDKLISWAILNLGVVVTMRVLYGWYCNRHFKECRYSIRTYDRTLAREMTSFAWWGFFGNTAWMFNTQGVNILINMFFGVVYNAARGVASQVEGAVMNFVGNFTTAIYPQITKSYASGDVKYLFSIVCRGTKFQFYMMLLFMIPIELEARTLLSLWLVDVPPLAPLFLQLSMISTLTTLYGNTTYTAIMATGKIRSYQLAVTVIGCLVFPLTYIAYRMGFPIYATYYIFIFIYTVLIGVRLIYMKKLMEFPISMFIRQTVVPSLYVTAISFVVPVLVVLGIPESIGRFFIVVPVAVVSTAATILYVGMTSNERKRVIGYVISRIRGISLAI